jgi:hypothetical protein
MQIVDSQIHLWENATMSPQHRQIPTYSMRWRKPGLTQR